MTDQRVAQPGTAPAPRPAPPTTDAESAARALDTALGRLDGLGAVSVHEHVEVYAEVDRALRRRLAAAEG